MEMLMFDTGGVVARNCSNQSTVALPSSSPMLPFVHPNVPLHVPAAQVYPVSCPERGAGETC